MDQTIPDLIEVETVEQEMDALIRQAQKDPAMFQHIYDRWVGSIYCYIYARVGNAQDSEDLTSQVFLQAFQAFPRYRHEGHFSAWLFTIARNQIKGVFRRKRLEEYPLSEADEVGANAVRPGGVHQADEISQLKDLIAALPEKEQELIRLRYIAELKFSDMALVVGRNEAAVKKSLYRVQDRLRHLLEAQNE